MGFIVHCFITLVIGMRKRRLWLTFCIIIDFSMLIQDPKKKYEAMIIHIQKYLDDLKHFKNEFKSYKVS